MTQDCDRFEATRAPVRMRWNRSDVRRIVPVKCCKLFLLFSNETLSPIQWHIQKFNLLRFQRLSVYLNISWNDGCGRASHWLTTVAESHRRFDGPVLYDRNRDEIKWRVTIDSGHFSSYLCHGLVDILWPVVRVEFRFTKIRQIVPGSRRKRRTGH